MKAIKICLDFDYSLGAYFCSDGVGGASCGTSGDGTWKDHKICCCIAIKFHFFFFCKSSNYEWGYVPL